MRLALRLLQPPLPFPIFASIVISTMVWSSSIIYLHKDMYTTLVETSKYMLQNIQGNISHNDTAAVLAWNIDYLYPSDNITGDFVDRKSVV